MISRTKRQIIYGIGYLVVIALVGFSLYTLTRPVPSCFDGIQNEGEQGIDCGGPCPPCALKTLQPISANAIAWLKANDLIVLVATLENPNDSYGASSVNYTFNGLNADGQQAFSIGGTTFLFASETKTIIETIPVAQAGVFQHISLETQSPQWQSAAVMVKPQMMIGNIAVASDKARNQTTISGTIRNKENNSYSIVGITALLYDFSGRLVGASKTQVSIGILGTEQFAVQYPYVDSIDPALTVVSYEAQ